MWWPSIDLLKHTVESAFGISYLNILDNFILVKSVGVIEDFKIFDKSDF